MSLLPHETLPNSKKRYVWRLCDRFWFNHRRKPMRAEIRKAYGLTSSSLDTVDSYLSDWWAHMKQADLAHA